jgi:hypothetical protein
MVNGELIVESSLIFTNNRQPIIGNFFLADDWLLFYSPVTVSCSREKTGC